MSRTYNLEDLPTVAVSDDAAAATTSEIGEATTIDNLDQLGVTAKVVQTIIDGSGYEQDFVQVYPTPSEARFAVLKALIEAGHPDEVLLGIMLDERYEVGTRKGERITEADATKDIRRARAKVKPKPAASNEFPIQPNSRYWAQPAMQGVVHSVRAAGQTTVAARMDLPRRLYSAEPYAYDRSWRHRQINSRDG